MKAILITIKSDSASMIYAGMKTIELRKRTPNVPIGTPCLIYEPLPIGRVTGYFTFAGSFNFDTIFPEHSILKKAGMSYSRMRDYYAHQLIGVAWNIEQPTPFPDAMSLADFNVFHTPRSYQLIDISDGVL